LRLGFTGTRLELLFLSQVGPWFTKNTLERTRETQCSPWPWRRRFRPKLGGSGGGFDRGRSGEGRGAYPQPVCGHRWAEGRRQLAGRWRIGSVAAASPAPAVSRSGKRHGWHREVVGAVWSCEEVVDYGETAGGATPRWDAQAGLPACAVACTVLDDARPL
jgi:hypothetical protein